ncbi:APC family permease [Rhodococcus opacus]|uniref:APC family permease n=1 Tax=Rhodococcus opacus TaxID=37919 RepID=UPI0003075385|nr:APC family permease [Rhodococcus opacus]MDX5964921.1 APC family permease [Rhodococcus opacus]NKY74706.1 APC family permease [Rhodococcus opacus]UNN04172.1 APC family permease [Rhodococcus opacus]UZG52435.1 APC family permease [Rhodococcus opacus]CAG7623233.1 Serine/threonine exchanger SteT [Rhodococcus opacus]
MAHATGDPGAAGKRGELKRVLGPGLLLFFIVGDILGAGVYAVTGSMIENVGGMAWLPFILAFIIATLTAFSYLELVTKYPQAAGAALYAHKAFGIHIVTFIVAFAVICSGITSASTSSNVVAGNLLAGLHETFSDAEGVGWFDIPTGDTAQLVVALLFMSLLAVINLRGVGESVKLNVVLTLIEMTALAVVIVIGLVAAGSGSAEGDIGNLVVFEDPNEKGWFLAVTVATAIAFFAMVGFEDSVNMVEETKNPERIFPKMMLTGLGVTCLIYILVVVAVIAVLPLDYDSGSEGILLHVVRLGAPGLPIDEFFPYLTVFAVANTALINMLMASRLIYGLAKQQVLPGVLGFVLPARRSPWAAIVFTTSMTLVLIVVVNQMSGNSVVGALSGTTGLLLLFVFAVVNIACLVLKRRADKTFFRAPVWVPVIAAVLCLFLAGPWARTEEQMIQYRIAGVMLVVGIVLWAITFVINKRSGLDTKFSDIDHLAADEGA